IVVAERHADGQVGDEELKQVYIEMSRFGQSNLVADSCRRAVRMSGRITPRIVGIAAENLARVVAEGTGRESEPGVWAGARRAAWEAESRAQVDFLRDIFGNPFRPAAIVEVWRTEHTVGIAATMYEERDFAAMPILADALEDAGCNNWEILDHCRSGGEHV